MSAQDYPLLIKNLLLAPRRAPTRNRIRYRDVSGYDYATFGERVARLGSALVSLGVRQGDTVAVMDWDTPRYLECYFAIPMLGAVLQTVNVRLPQEYVRYTIDHAGASVLLCNLEFLPLLESVRAGLPRVRKVICLTDSGAAPGFPFDGEYEQLLVIKTSEERVDALREVLFGRHPYEVPEFIVIPIDRIEGAYREWLLDAVSAG